MGAGGRVSVARLLLVTAALAGCAGAPEVIPAAGPVAEAPLRATYTAEQAESGRRVFGSVCSVCHGRNEFRGPIFELTWVSEPVGHVFQHISTTMPQDDPGSLSLEQYVSIVAYFLELNGRDPGEQALTSDVEVLNRMRW